MGKVTPLGGSPNDSGARIPGRGAPDRANGLYGRADDFPLTEADMGIFQRAHDIVQAKTNKALDAAEKPDEMLDLSYEKMLEQITQVRRALVDLAAAKARSAVILTSGFAETGQSGRDLQQKVATAAAAHGVRLLGPNSNGIISARSGLAGTIMTPGIAHFMDSMAGQPGWGATREENESIYAEKLYPQPVPRLGRTSEIAAAVALLASPLSNYTTGAMLRIDGGISKAL